MKITVNCVCVDTTFVFSGNTGSSGTKGNIRTFTVNEVSVKASAFSRTNGSGAWATAYLGLFGPGLGATDSSESGGNDTHKVDNEGGRNNYVLFEFSSPVVIDRVFLDCDRGRQRHLGMDGHEDRSVHQSHHVERRALDQSRAAAG